MEAIKWWYMEVASMTGKIVLSPPQRNGLFQQQPETHEFSRLIWQQKMFYTLLGKWLVLRRLIAFIQSWKAAFNYTAALFVVSLSFSPPTLSNGRCSLFRPLHSPLSSGQIEAWKIGIRLLRKNLTENCWSRTMNKREQFLFETT